MPNRLALAALLPLLACQAPPAPGTAGSAAPTLGGATPDADSASDDPEGLGDAAFDPQRAEAVLDATWHDDVLVSNDAVVLDDQPGFLGFEAPVGSTLVALHFDSPAHTSDVRAGAVIVSARDGGLLRRVEDVSFDGNTAIAATSSAQLTDVLFVANHFERLDLPLLPGDLGGEGRDPFVREFGGLTLLSLGEPGSRVVVDVPTGSVALDPGLDWGIDVDWFDWDRPWPKVNKADLTVTLQAELEAVLHAAAEGAFDRDGRHDLLEFSKGFDFRVGPVPVAGEVAFDVDLVWLAEGDGAVDGSIGARVETEAALGGRYDGDWHNASGFDWRAERIGPSFEASGALRGRVALAVHAEVAMYGAVSADLDAEPWLDGQANLACGAIDWRLDAGVTLDSEVGYDVLGLSDTRRFPTLSYAREPLAEGTVAVYDATALGAEHCGEGDVPPAESSASEHDSPATGGDDAWLDDEEVRAQANLRESCVDGVDDDGDGATDCEDSECAAKIACGSQCHVWDQLACGQVISADSGGVVSDRKSLVDAYPVNVGLYTGPEVGFAFRPPRTGAVRFQLEGANPTEVDHDVILLHSPTGVCNPDDAVIWGSNGLEAEVVAGENYIVLIDGYNGDEGHFTLSVDCSG